MVSNLSSIGFSFSDKRTFEEKIVELADRSKLQADCDVGQYAVWRDASGAAMWIHVVRSEAFDTPAQIDGLTPFFEGKSRVELRLTEAFRRPDDNPFEGSFSAWVAPDDAGEGAYPLMFDAVDYALHANAPLPRTVAVQLTGFAREIDCFPNEETFYSVTRDEKIKLHAPSFIPIGLFALAEQEGFGDPRPDAADADDNAPPSAAAMLTGTIVEHRQLENTDTSLPFHWFLIDTLDARVDVVADPATITGAIAPGGIIRVVCWFFGRIHDVPPVGEP